MGIRLNLGGEPSRRMAWAALTLLAGLALTAAWALTRPRSPEERATAAGRLASGIHVSATVHDISLVAGRAIADFGVGSDIRLVRVRMVDGLSLDLAISSDAELVLATHPRLCLVGPYSAPDDAGLSVPCWGEPDLVAALTPRLALDDAGHPVIAADAPVEWSGTLARGDQRCDYAPGAWHLDVGVDPLIDGGATGVIWLPSVGLQVPWAANDTLVAADASRYCGLAETIVKEQGEPLIVTP